MSRHVLLDSTWSRQQFLIFDCMYNEITLLCFAPYMSNHEAVPMKSKMSEGAFETNVCFKKVGQTTVVIQFCGLFKFFLKQTLYIYMQSSAYAVL